MFNIYHFTLPPCHIKIFGLDRKSFWTNATWALHIKTTEKAVAKIFEKSIMKV